MANKGNERYLSVPEVAQKLNFCYNTVWLWVKNGKLRGYNFSGGYRIKEKDLEEFIRDCKVTK